MCCTFLLTSTPLVISNPTSDGQLKNGTQKFNDKFLDQQEKKIHSLSLVKTIFSEFDKQFDGKIANMTFWQIFFGSE